MERKCFAVVLSLLLIILFLSPALYASVHPEQSDISKTQETSDGIEQKHAEATAASPIFNNGYNVFYQFINNNEYLFTPLSSAMAGGVVCGPWCAFAGLMVGIADETSIYFGFTGKHYLTWGIFGVATGHAIRSSLMAEIVGAVVGIILPTGVLNDHKELIAPAISAIAGSSMSGTSGLINGAVAGALDEVAIHDGIANKHYMTFCTISMAVTNLLGWLNPTVANFVGLLVGSVAAEYEDKIFMVWIPIKVGQDLYTTYNKLLPEGQLDSHIEKQALALFGSQFIIQYLDLRLIEYEQGLAYNFERFDSPNSLAWRKFQPQFVHFVIFIFPYIAGQTVSTFINDYFSTKLLFALEDKLKAEWLAGETALCLSHGNDTAVLLDNLKTDMSMMAISGNKLITSAISMSIKGVYGFGIIISSSSDMLVYSTGYSQLCSIISEYLAKQQRIYEEQIKIYESKLANIVKHDSNNIEIVIERDGIEFTQKKLQRVYNILREYEVNKVLWEQASNIWRSVSGVTDFMFNYYLIGYKINLGRLPFENRNKIQSASHQMSSLLSWSGKNAVEIARMYQSLDRINVLTEKIHAKQISTDQINRIFRIGDQLILKDLEITVGDKALVTVDHLELEMGKAYAITGESGSGKSSLLSKIKGIKTNSIGGSGYIYYPLVGDEEPKIIMITQRDYFPADSSLLEIIYYPSEVSSDPLLRDKEKKKALSILEEMRFFVSNAAFAMEDSNIEKNEEILDLDSIEDWYTVLSGGEKKKVIVASAVIKNPDILILDEIFTGLDSESIVLIQEMLEKYLPNTLILVVDHHAKDNNFNSFYYKELHFSNKKIIVEDMV